MQQCSSTRGRIVVTPCIGCWCPPKRSRISWSNSSTRRVPTSSQFLTSWIGSPTCCDATNPVSTKPCALLPTGLTLWATRWRPGRGGTSSSRWVARDEQRCTPFRGLVQGADRICRAGTPGGRLPAVHERRPRQDNGGRLQGCQLPVPGQRG